jgi:hypothetical protein
MQVLFVNISVFKVRQHVRQELFSGGADLVEYIVKLHHVVQNDIVGLMPVLEAGNYFSQGVHLVFEDDPGQFDLYKAVKNLQDLHGLQDILGTIVTFDIVDKTVKHIDISNLINEINLLASLLNELHLDVSLMQFDNAIEHLTFLHFLQEAYIQIQIVVQVAIEQDYQMRLLVVYHLVNCSNLSYQILQTVFVLLQSR